MRVLLTQTIQGVVKATIPWFHLGSNWSIGDHTLNFHLFKKGKPSLKELLMYKNNFLYVVHKQLMAYIVALTQEIDFHIVNGRSFFW